MSAFIPPRPDYHSLKADAEYRATRKRTPLLLIAAAIIWNLYRGLIWTVTFFLKTLRIRKQ